MTINSALKTLFEYFNIEEDVVVCYGTCSTTPPIYVISNPVLIIPFSFGCLFCSGIGDKRVISIIEKDSLLKSSLSLRLVTNFPDKDILTVVITNDKEINFKKIALTYGYKYSFMVNSIDSLNKVMKWINNKQEYSGSKFLEIRVTDSDINKELVSNKLLDNFVKRSN